MIKTIVRWANKKYYMEKMIEQSCSMCGAKGRIADMNLYCFTSYYYLCNGCYVKHYVRWFFIWNLLFLGIPIPFIFLFKKSLEKLDDKATEEFENLSGIRKSDKDMLLRPAEWRND